VRDDGQRLFYGALPTLIQWGPVHPDRCHARLGPGDARAARRAPARAALAAALSAIGMASMPVDAGPPNLVAVLDTPRGPVTLESKGL
jgi:acetylornithine deacetylase/succinyl-diaminopimelate desuccinylase-like protein